MGHASALTARYGGFGGRFVPESLFSPLEDVEQLWRKAKQDEGFWRELDALLDHRAGRPTGLTPLFRLQAEQGGALLWLKREDLAAGGNYCVISACVQALLAQRAGRKVVVTESATGAFGVALGGIGAALGLEVAVYMTRDDALREKRRVELMRQLGVRVELAESTVGGRFVAQAWAMREWVDRLDECFYCSSTLASPDPYPGILARATSMIGAELVEQLKRARMEPSSVICPVGSGALAAGIFDPFLSDAQRAQSAQLIGVQGCGDDAEDRVTSLCGGRPGYLHGVRSYLHQSEDGLILSATTRAKGLAEPVVGPQHAQWLERGQVIYVPRSDGEAAAALWRVARLEGLMLAPETGCALAYAMKNAATLSEDEHVVLVVSGAGSAELEWIKERAKSATPTAGLAAISVRTHERERR